MSRRRPTRTSASATSDGAPGGSLVSRLWGATMAPAVAAHLFARRFFCTGDVQPDPRTVGHIGRTLSYISRWVCVCMVANSTFPLSLCVSLLSPLLWCIAPAPMFAWCPLFILVFCVACRACGESCGVRVFYLSLGLTPLSFPNQTRRSPANARTHLGRARPS